MKDHGNFVEGMHLFHLPEEVLVRVLEWCPAREVVALERVCRLFNHLTAAYSQRLARFDDKSLDFRWNDKQIIIQCDDVPAVPINFVFDSKPSTWLPKSSFEDFECGDENAIVFSRAPRIPELVTFEAMDEGKQQEAVDVPCSYVLGSDEEMELDIVEGPADENLYNGKNPFPAVMAVVNNTIHRMYADSLVIVNLTPTEIAELTPYVPDDINELDIVGETDERVILALLEHFRDIHTLKLKRTTLLSAEFYRTKRVRKLRKLTIEGPCEMDDDTMLELRATELDVESRHLTKHGVMRMIRQWGAGKRRIHHHEIAFENIQRDLPVEVLLEFLAASGVQIRPSSTFLNGAMMKREDGQEMEILVVHHERGLLGVELARVEDDDICDMTIEDVVEVVQK